MHLYVNTDGTPKHDIQWNNKASTQSFVLVAERGIASAQRVDLSMMVKICVKPFELGKGPTIST